MDGWPRPAPLQFRHKLVRDLAHAVYAVPLLQVASGEADAGAIWARLAAASGGEKQIQGSGGYFDPPGPLTMHLHTV
jgi:hypothetical protein